MRNTILMFFSVLTLCATFSCSSLFAKDVSVTTAEDAISIDGHYFVDLALPSGKLWAMTNVGASTPYEDGDYFAWGETETKSSYTKGNYRFQSEYNRPTVHEKGTGARWDCMTVLDDEFDVATVRWGNNCHMPDDDDVYELLSFCVWTWTDGGYVVRGRNGKSIFLPASGFKDGSQLTMHGKQGKYWTGTGDFGSSFLFDQRAKFPTTGIPSQDEDKTFNYQGCTVRPVAQSSKAVDRFSALSTYYESLGVTPIHSAIKIGDHYFVDLDLPSGKLWAMTNVGASTPYEYGSYYAWGETESYEEQSKSGGAISFKWGDFSENGIRKYNNYDHKTMLDPDDDVATVKWGKACSMPSPEDFNELLAFCEWQWHCGGYVVKGRNGNAIFLPGAGYLDGKLQCNGSGEYWTNTGNNGYCKDFTFGYSNAGKLEEVRAFDSRPIRPVAERVRRLVE